MQKIRSCRWESFSIDPASRICLWQCEKMATTTTTTTTKMHAASRHRQGAITLSAGWSSTALVIGSNHCIKWDDGSVRQRNRTSGTSRSFVNVPINGLREGLPKKTAILCIKVLSKGTHEGGRRPKDMGRQFFVLHILSIRRTKEKVFSCFTALSITESVLCVT